MRRNFLVLGVAALLAVLLAACGGSSETTPQEITVPTVTDTDSTPTTNVQTNGTGRSKFVNAYADW